MNVNGYDLAREREKLFERTVTKLSVDLAHTSQSSRLLQSLEALLNAILHISTAAVPMHFVQKNK